MYTRKIILDQLQTKGCKIFMSKVKYLVSKWLRFMFTFDYTIYSIFLDSPHYTFYWRTIFQYLVQAFGVLWLPKEFISGNTVRNNKLSSIDNL